MGTLNTPQPGFVVVGGEHKGPDGNTVIVLMASVTLCEIDLREEYEIIQSWGASAAISARDRRNTLTVSMGDYVSVAAESYPEAWQMLFDAMNPPAFQDEASQSMIKTHYAFHPPEPPPWQRRREQQQQLYSWPNSL